MTAPWQLILTWGVVSGIGSGCVANVLSATIVNRWFVTNRGLVMGLLAASHLHRHLDLLSRALGHPGMRWLEAGGDDCRRGAGACSFPSCSCCCRNGRQDVGSQPFGADADHPIPARVNRQSAEDCFRGDCSEGLQNRDFWLLAGTFFVCGFTTNGLVGTHMIALCGDHGMDAVAAGGLLAIMGLFDLVGTTASGWLTDRYDPRKLLFAYYGLRGLSLIYLPFADFSFRGLSLFAVFYGLDWIATVPPTLAHRQQRLRHNKGAGDVRLDRGQPQIGAAAAAFLAGASRSATGSYLESFVVGRFCRPGGRPGGADDRARTESGSNRSRLGLADITGPARVAGQAPNSASVTLVKLLIIEGIF